MPIGFNGQQYQSEVEMLLGSSEKAQEGPETSSGTQVPTSKNNAPTGSAAPLESIPNDITRITVRPQPDYVNPPENSRIPTMVKGIEGMVKSVWDAMLAPGNALQGKVPVWAMDPETGEFHTSRDVIEKTNDLAGLMVMGPAPVASKLAEGTLGSFAGVRSATLDKTKLYKAQNMELQGAHPDEIWKETGFFKGADNRWRYEIPNDYSNILKEGTEEVGKQGILRIKEPRFEDLDIRAKDFPERWDEFLKNEGKGVPLDKVLHDPGLFKAYPHLKDIKVKDMPNGLSGQGAYSSSENVIYMAPSKADEFIKILQHEVQHAIQRHEGFAYGGNSRMFASPEYLNKKAIFEQTMDKTFNKLKTDHPDFDFDSLRGSIEAKINGNYERFPEIKPSIDSVIEEAKKRGFYDTVEKYITAAKKIDELESINYQKYRRLMGEVEARNVETRLDFDNTERFLNSPRSTEDIPRFLQRDPGEASTFQ